MMNSVTQVVLSFFQLFSGMTLVEIYEHFGAGQHFRIDLVSGSDGEMAVYSEGSHANLLWNQYKKQDRVDGHHDVTLCLRLVPGIELRKEAQHVRPSEIRRNMNNKEMLKSIDSIFQHRRINTVGGTMQNAMKCMADVSE